MLRRALLLGFFGTLPYSASAQSGDIFSLAEGLITLINSYIIPFLLSLAVLFFIYNVTRYFVIESGNPEGREKARAFAFYGLLAFVFIVAFWGIISFVIRGFGFDQNTQAIVPDYIQQYVQSDDDDDEPDPPDDDPDEPDPPDDPPNGDPDDDPICPDGTEHSVVNTPAGLEDVCSPIPSAETCPAGTQHDVVNTPGGLEDVCQTIGEGTSCPAGTQFKSINTLDGMQVICDIVAGPDTCPDGTQYNVINVPAGPQDVCQPVDDDDEPDPPDDDLLDDLLDAIEQLRQGIVSSLSGFFAGRYNTLFGNLTDIVEEGRLVADLNRINAGNYNDLERLLAAYRFWQMGEISGDQFNEYLAAINEYRSEADLSDIPLSSVQSNVAIPFPQSFLDEREKLAQDIKKGLEEYNKAVPTGDQLSDGTIETLVQATTDFNIPYSTRMGHIGTLMGDNDGDTKYLRDPENNVLPWYDLEHKFIQDLNVEIFFNGDIDDLM